MYVRKNFTIRGILSFAGGHLIWLSCYMTLITLLHQLTDLNLSIPWLPVSLIGTAVAFYVGFKNNQSYDRMWEARKIWGAIVNSSRGWGSMVDAYIKSNQIPEEKITTIKKKLIYRHIAWLYTLREQLLVPTQWEHVSLSRHIGQINVRRREKQGTGQFKDYLTPAQEQRYFSDKNKWAFAANHATQIIHHQSLDLAQLNENGIIDDYKQVEMQNVLNEFYDEQGKAERIKKFPLPRQYANLSFVFVCVFIFLLPYGIVGEFAKLGEKIVWLAIPLGTLVGWIYVVMELIGDYSENPFEGLGTDIPMLAICRTIEIDLLQMINETDIPKPVQPVNDILM